LLALTGKLFDSVPLERMRDAERALREAAVELPAEVIQRFTSADKLSDSDREAILQIARETLAPFQSASS
jgi:F-type H+-transporting ATPase subunit alpha